MRRRLRATAALLAATLAAAACTSGGETKETPIPGGSLRVSIRDLTTLDPAKARTPGELFVVSQVFDSLTAVDPKTGEIVPAAAAWWKVRNNGTQWIFRLRDGVFQDGKPVTAADFKFAFDRIAAKKTASEAAFQLEQVKGFRAARIDGTTATLAGVRAEGDSTLVIDLSTPFAELPVALAHPALAPLPRAVYAKSTSGLRFKPVGNGPFAVASGNLEKALTLNRFDAYAGQTAYLDTLRLVVATDVAEGWRAFQDGEVDVAEAPPAALEGDGGGFTPLWASVYYGPNLRLAKYKSADVRRALSLAIDRKALAAVVYGGSKDPATGLLPRGIRGYVPDACPGTCVLNRARATELLQKAFPNDPLTITVDHLADETSTRVARAIASDLEKAGVKASLRAHTAAAYLSLLQSERHDFAQLGWLSDVPSPDGFLAQQLMSGSPNNPMGYSDKTFDSLITKARAEEDEGKRLALYREAEKRVLAQMPLIPIVFFRNRLAAADKVRGFAVNGAGRFDASAVWLSPAA